MQSELAATPLVLRDRQPAFALTKGTQLPSVEERPRLTLSRMQTAVDAIESAEGRAQKVVDRATASFGKTGTSGATRFVDSGLSWVAILGSTAAACWAGWHFFDGWACVGAVLVGGAAALIGTGCGCDYIKDRDKRRMARSTLEPQHLAELATMRGNATERSLELAAIGRVARRTLQGLKDKEIFHTKDTAKLLTEIAGDDALGDAVARAELERHLALVVSLRGLTHWNADADSYADGLIRAFGALTPDERTAIANDLTTALFEGEIPRGDGLSYAKAVELREVLSNPSPGPFGEVTSET